MRAAVVTLLLALGAPALASAQADWAVRGRASLPLDGRPLDLAPYVPKDEPVARVVLTGTVSSLLDGSEIDGLGRRTRGGIEAEPEGSFVRLPAGATVVSSDPRAGRYVIEVPVADAMPIALNPFPLAARHLVTRDALLRSLHGGVEVEVMTPAAVVATAALAAPAPEPAGAPTGLLGALLAFPLLAGGALLWRRRRREEARLMARCDAAARVIERESVRLGPAFDEVVSSGRSMHESAVGVRRHVAAMDRALKKTAWTRSGAAAARRVELETERLDALMRLRILTERLEDTSVRLMGRSADHARPLDVDGRMESLAFDLDAALSADDESRGVEATS